MELYRDGNKETKRVRDVKEILHALMFEGGGWDSDGNYHDPVLRVEHIQEPPEPLGERYDVV